MQEGELITRSELQVCEGVSRSRWFSPAQPADRTGRNIKENSQKEHVLMGEGRKNKILVNSFDTRCAPDNSDFRRESIFFQEF